MKAGLDTKGGGLCHVRAANGSRNWRALGKLRARLPVYKRRVAYAQRRIRAALLHSAKHVAVSYSYGKDSSVLLHLARAVDPAVKAVYVDQGASTPDTLAWRSTFPEEIYGPVDTVDAKLKFEAACVEYGWWGCAAGDAPRKKFNQVEWDRLIFDEPLAAWYAQNDVSTILVGIRAQESGRRKRLQQGVSWKTGVQRGTKDPVRVYPLIDWDVQDVWAYIAVHDLPYNPVYDRECLGFDRYTLRVSPILSAGGHLSHGVVAWLHAVYPEWFAEMRRRFPTWGAMG